MRWKNLRRSSNVRDVRGAGGMRMPVSIGRGGRVGGGLGAVILIVLVLVFGGPEAVMQLLGGGGSAPSGEQGAPLTANDETSDFVARVLGSTEDEWGRLFAQSGETYQEPLLTVFSSAVQSACGFASSASGPFYCPADRRVYLDTAFFDQLARMGGSGDFAAAYVKFAPRSSARARWRRIACKYRWSCKPIALPVSGPITPIKPRTCSSPATCRKGSPPPKPSATTRYNATPAAA